MTEPAVTVQVVLADAPTDVLVYLVDFGGAHRLGDILAAVAPPDSVDAAATAASAVRLLLDIGYIERGAGQTFRASEAGREAVAAARVSAREGSS